MLLLADIILVIHGLFISFVVLAVPLTIAGGIAKWKWVKNPWFRFLHLLMIGFVAFESVIGMDCPLTIWENQLRIAAGETGYEQEGLIADLLHRLFFFSLPHWVFIALYVGYAVLVAGLFYVVPVKWNNCSVP